MSKVTIAIPTYNRKEYLKECIESILMQTFQDFSIIVFDNCSDYDVRAFLAGFKDERISLASSVVNMGGADNFHRIFKSRFDSEYAVVFHDDDVMHPELLGREVSVMDSHPELVWVGTNLRFVKDHATMHDFANIGNSPASLYDTAGIVRLILQGFDLCYDSVMYRSSYLEDATPFTNLYSKWGDRPYLVVLSKKGKVGVLKEKLVNYRIHPGQDSQAVALDVVQYAINLALYYKECLGGLRTAFDRRLFYSYVVNNVIPVAFFSTHTIKEFMQSIEPYQRNDLLRLRYINLRGVVRSVRAIVKRIKNK